MASEALASGQSWVLLKSDRLYVLPSLRFLLTFLCFLEHFQKKTAELIIAKPELVCSEIYIEFFLVPCPLLNLGGKTTYFNPFWQQPICQRPLCRNGATFENSKTCHEGIVWLPSPLVQMMKFHPATPKKLSLIFTSFWSLWCGAYRVAFNSVNLIVTGMKLSVCAIDAGWKQSVHSGNHWLPE